MHDRDLLQMVSAHGSTTSGGDKVFVLVTGMASILLSVSCLAAPVILDWMSPRLSLSNLSLYLFWDLCGILCVDPGPLPPPALVSKSCLHFLSLRLCLSANPLQSGLPRFGVFPELLQGIPSH